MEIREKELGFLSFSSRDGYKGTFANRLFVPKTMFSQSDEKFNGTVTETGWKAMVTTRLFPKGVGSPK